MLLHGLVPVVRVVPRHPLLAPLSQVVAASREIASLLLHLLAAPGCLVVVHVISHRSGSGMLVRQVVSLARTGSVAQHALELGLFIEVVPSVGAGSRSRSYFVFVEEVVVVLAQILPDEPWILVRIRLVSGLGEGLLLVVLQGALLIRHALDVAQRRHLLSSGILLTRLRRISRRNLILVGACFLGAS